MTFFTKQLLWNLVGYVSFFFRGDATETHNQLVKTSCGGLSLVQQYFVTSWNRTWTWHTLQSTPIQKTTSKTSGFLRKEGLIKTTPSSCIWLHRQLCWGLRCPGGHFFQSLWNGNRLGKVQVATGFSKHSQVSHHYYLRVWPSRGRYSDYNEF